MKFCETENRCSFQMFSKQADKKKIGWEEGFRWRGHGEVSRIESLSDAVFGLAVTLLIISQDVPKTYNGLLQILMGFIPFAACFAQLMLVWFEHYKFYRRYNLQDDRTVVLTMVLLCIVLFYVYPLKFMFSSWMMPNEFIVKENEIAGLFTIYGVGFILVFGLFILLFRHALTKREELQLTEVEIWDTKHSIREGYINCGVAVISII